MGNQDDIKNKDYSVTTAIWIAAALLAADVYENNPNASDMDYYFKQTDIQALAQRFTDKDVHPARISQWPCADAEDHTYNYLRSAGGEGSSFRRLTNPAEMDGYRTLPEDLDINADDSKFMSDNHSYTLEELFRFA